MRDSVRVGGLVSFSDGVQSHCHACGRRTAGAGGSIRRESTALVAPEGKGGGEGGCAASMLASGVIIQHLGLFAIFVLSAP